VRSKEKLSFTSRDKEKSKKYWFKSQIKELPVLELKKKKSKEELSSVREKLSSEETR
jgi:hypothetical protein